MGDTRIRYGFAMGRMNNFDGIAGQKGYLAGTDGLLAQGNTAPTVTNGFLFYANNSAATTIVDFQLEHPSVGTGDLSGLFEGKWINVWLLDTNTRIASNSRIVLAGTDGCQGANTIVEFLYHNSSWYEFARSRPGSDQITGASITSAGLGAVAAIDAQGKKVVNITTSAGTIPIVIRKALNGEQGQIITFINKSASSMLIVCNSGGADTFVSSNSSAAANMVITNSSAISFIRSEGQWWEIRTASAAGDLA